MKLKNAFQIKSTATHLLPIPPSHNNNQPFNNVNLALNEYRVSNDPLDIREGNGTVSVYSLYDDEVDGGGGFDEPRGSENLRFITNEYGMMELIDSDAESDSEESDSEESFTDSNEDLDPEEHEEPPQIPVSPEPLPDPLPDPQILSCITCGTFGLTTEFYDKHHCTHDCSVITKINECKMKHALEEEESKKRELEEENEEIEEIEVDCKRIKLEVEEFIDNPFRVNDLLEAIDPQHQSLFCPCVVVEVLGYRLLVKFIGYSDKYCFWVNADSDKVFPVNWSKTYSKTHSSKLHFHAPQTFTTWEDYIASNESFRVAPESNFPHVKGLLSCPESPIKVGMKVEAVDRRNKNLICVATISCVMGDRFLIHFDSWDSLYDYWTWCGSGDIHPVGYCKSHGIDITPPHCYENASEFDWDEYLKKTNSVPIPPGLITRTNDIPYQVGQMVEVIDKRSPRLLRTALIKNIDTPTQTLSLHFPSLKSELYDYDICAWSQDIHPQGWGSSTGHPLADDEEERSPSPDSFPVCPGHKICKSVCSTRGPNFAFHSKTRDCPYSIPNMNDFSECGRFTDRVVVFEDAHYDVGVKIKQEIEELNDKEQQVEKIKLDVKAYALVHKPQTQALVSRNSNPINFNKFNVPKVEPNQQIPKRSEILTWSHDRISSLVESLCSNLPTAQKVADQFRNNLIDGESFLMLTQADITNALGIKLGPAVKIYNLIRLIELNK